MTIFDQNTRLNSRASRLGSMMNQALHAAAAAWATLRTLMAPRPINPEQDLAKAARREAARRATDNLLR